MVGGGEGSVQVGNLDLRSSSSVIIDLSITKSLGIYKPVGVFMKQLRNFLKIIKIVTYAVFMGNPFYYLLNEQFRS